MLVRRYEPFNDIRRSFDLVNQIINTMDKSVENDGALVDFVPKVNTREDKDAYYIEVELAGVKKEDVEIKVDGNILTVSGEKKFRDGMKADDYYKIESNYGTFARSFTLPEKVDVAKIEAKSHDRNHRNYNSTNTSKVTTNHTKQDTQNALPRHQNTREARTPARQTKIDSAQYAARTISASTSDVRTNKSRKIHKRTKSHGTT